MSLVPASSAVVPSAEYRYLMVNTLTDEVVVEVPFQNVSYANALNEAGSFSGDVPVNVATDGYDLYNSTLPGLMSLYVLRGQTCMWGGIVSGRTYNAKDRLLSVTADNFVSYLDRRVLWKTWSTKYSCIIDIDDMTVDGEVKRIGKVTLRGNASFKEEEIQAIKDSAFVSFGDVDLAIYSKTYTVLSDPAPDLENGKFFYFAAYYIPKGKKNYSPIPKDRVAEPSTSVEFKQSTKQFLKNLITNHFNDDTYDLGFNPEAIGAARLEQLQIAGLSRTNNVVTVTIDSRDERHNLVVGQRIAVKDISSPNNFLNAAKTKVTGVVDNLRFTYASPTSGANIAGFVPVSPEFTVLEYFRVDNVVTMITSTNHTFEVGDIVSITGRINTRLDGKIRHTITTVGKVAKGSTTNPARVFQFELAGPKISRSNAPAGSRVRKIPIVEAYTGGPFTGNSNIRINFEESEFDNINSTQKIYQSGIRGDELLTFKEILDKYSDDVYGFDYRIDCVYDFVGNSFSRDFKFLSLKPESLTNAIAALPGGVLAADEVPELSYFGADNRVFEYPGNVTNIDMTETIEEGATRVWVQGSNSVVSENASQPYAGIGDTVLLREGWPLFDKVVKKDKMSDPGSLYTVGRSILGQSQLPVSTFTIEVNGSISPSVDSYKPGDWCVLVVDDLFIQERINSYSETRGTTGRNVLLRKIAAVEVSVPINPAFPEVVTLTLVTEPGIDINGDESKWRWPNSIDGGGAAGNPGDFDPNPLEAI